jgi:lipopolysaccharide transport system permease protein
MQRLINILMMLFFYATPILYPISMVPQEYKIVVYLSPFTPFILSWKALFIGSEVSWVEIALMLVYTTALFIFSTKLYNKLKYKFAELV